MRSNAVLIFLTLGFCSCAIGSRILGLFPVPIRSHYVFYEKLLVALSHRGHTVDVITHFPSGETIKKYLYYPHNNIHVKLVAYVLVSMS